MFKSSALWQAIFTASERFAQRGGRRCKRKAESARADELSVAKMSRSSAELYLEERTYINVFVKTNGHTPSLLAPSILWFHFPLLTLAARHGVPVDCWVIFESPEEIQVGFRPSLPPNLLGIVVANGQLDWFFWANRVVCIYSTPTSTLGDHQLIAHICSRQNIPHNPLHVRLFRQHVPGHHRH